MTFVVAFCGVLLFFFVPETFWDRAPIPRSRKSRPAFFRRLSSRHEVLQAQRPPTARPSLEVPAETATAPAVTTSKTPRVGFAPEVVSDSVKRADTPSDETSESDSSPGKSSEESAIDSKKNTGVQDVPATSKDLPQAETPQHPRPAKLAAPESPSADPSHGQRERFNDADSEAQSIRTVGPRAYTATLRDQPARSFVQQLKPFNGRLNNDKWHKVAVRPLILFSYPAVLWSSVVYACSVGWLIVISESVAVIYREGGYHFNALQTGLVYISPFVGGILGSAVAGRVSDAVVQAMARRNGGLYEPEFRLVMAIPIAVTTVVGLMGFGWSAQLNNHWMVPTVFFGVVSFGCCLGSTTSITFCVDSYRQYAGEALVTLNFSKNVLHGLVFSLFVTGWLTDDGPKTVYIWIGVIQLILLVFSVPMYIYGKRARMWTVRKNFMERF